MNTWLLGSPVKLHIGCGPRILRGFINIDLTFEPFANYMQHYGEEHYPASVRGNQYDFVAFDVRSGPLPLTDESVDLIFHEDFIEHLDQRSQILFLAETYRVLKLGAVHRVNTPNLLSSMRESTFTRGFVGVNVREWDAWQHQNVLTPHLLEDYAQMIGYSRIVFNAKNQSISPLVPIEYRPDPRSRSVDGNLFADLVK